MVRSVVFTSVGALRASMHGQALARFAHARTRVLRRFARASEGRPPRGGAGESANRGGPHEKHGRAVDCIGRVAVLSLLLSACSLQAPAPDAVFAPKDEGGPGIDAPDNAPAGFPSNERLVLHYRFDESSGNIAHDFAGERDGIVYGEPRWVASGRVGGALRLSGQAGDGGTSNYVELPPGVLAELESCTIATWFNWDGINAWERVFDFGNGIPVWIYFTPRDALGGARLAGRRPDPEGIFIELPVEQTVRASTWTHLAVTWTRSMIRVYLDGKLVGDAVPLGGVTATDLGRTGRNWLGRSQFRPGEHPAGFVDPDFAGLIDDFRIYDRALTAAEVRALQAVE